MKVVYHFLEADSFLSFVMKQIMIILLYTKEYLTLQVLLYANTDFE